MLPNLSQQGAYRQTQTNTEYSIIYSLTTREASKSITPLETATTTTATMPTARNINPYDLVRDGNQPDGVADGGRIPDGGRTRCVYRDALSVGRSVGFLPHFYSVGYFYNVRKTLIILYFLSPSRKDL